MRQTVDDQCLLGVEQGALGDQERQAAVDADQVAALGQAVVLLVGADQIALGLQLLLIGLAGGQAVADLLEGALNALLILRHADVFLDLAVIQAGLQAAGVEDRQADLRLKQPTTRTGIKQPSQIRAQAAGIGGQTYAREECRAGGADIGIGGFQGMLGGKNVRAPLQ